MRALLAAVLALALAAPAAAFAAEQRASLTDIEDEVIDILVRSPERAARACRASDRSFGCLMYRV
jgi:hypothetical protein